MVAKEQAEIDFAINGMDCQEEPAHIERAVSALHGVHDEHAPVAAGRAIFTFDPWRVTPERIRLAEPHTAAIPVENGVVSKAGPNHGRARTPTFRRGASQGVERLRSSQSV